MVEHDFVAAGPRCFALIIKLPKSSVRELMEKELMPQTVRDRASRTSEASNTDEKHTGMKKATTYRIVSSALKIRPVHDKRLPSSLCTPVTLGTVT